MSTKLWILAALLVAATIVTGVAPANPAAAKGGVATAARTGERWGPSHGPEGGPAFALAVAPSAPETVYVGTGRGVFRSTNGGRSWTSAGLARRPRRELARRSRRSRSTRERRERCMPASIGRWDGGDVLPASVQEHERRAAPGARSLSDGQPVAISPTGPPTVYAQPVGSAERAVCSGARTAAAAGSRPTAVFLRPICGRSPSTRRRRRPSTRRWARRGIFESSDSGARWRSLGVSPAYGPVTAIAVDPRHPLTVYAGTDAGVIKSLDGGRSWRMVNAAMGGHGRDRRYVQVSALVVDPRDSRTVYATTRCAGVFKSTDGGRRWSPANAGLEPECPWAYSLALDPRAPQTVYAADPVRGVFKSLDGGARWRVANTGLSACRPVSSLAVDPQRPADRLRERGRARPLQEQRRRCPLAFARVRPKLVDGVALDPSSPRNILAAGSTPGVRSGSSGAPTPAAPGRRGKPRRRRPDGWLSSRSAAKRRMPAAPRSGSLREHGRRAQLARVGPLGVSVRSSARDRAGRRRRRLRRHRRLRERAWPLQEHRRRQQLAAPHRCARHGRRRDRARPRESRDDLHRHPGGGVFKSTDGGTSWQPDQGSGSRTATVTSDRRDALAIDPAHPTTLYAATGGRGVFRSTDSGKSWQSFNAGLTALDVRTLALDATGQTLYAGTSGGGVVSVHPKR